MAIPYNTFPSFSVWEYDSGVFFSIRKSDHAIGIIDELVRQYNDPSKTAQQIEILFHLYQACDFWLRKLNKDTANRGEPQDNITGAGLPVGQKVSGNINRRSAMSALKDITGELLANHTGQATPSEAMTHLETIYGTESHGGNANNPGTDANQINQVRAINEVAIFLDQAYMQRRYKLRFRNGVAWRWDPVNNTNAIYDTRSGLESERNQDQLTHFVMDARGRIYAGFNNDVFWFKHSSFVGGANAHAAGRIKIVDGCVTEVVNDSGHYEPTIQQMRNLLQRLRLYGCVVDGIDVRRISPAPKASFKGNQIMNTAAHWPDGV